MKLRKRRKMAKRLAERRAVPIPSSAPRGAFNLPGSQNPHKGRWAKAR